MPGPARLRSDADIDLLVAIYARSTRRIEKLIRASAARGATGTEAYFRQQRGAIRRELAKLERQTPELLERAMRRSYLDGATITEALLASPEGLPTGAEGRFFGVHEEALAAIAGRLNEHLAQARATIGRQVEDAFARATRGAVEEGIAAGLTRKQVSKQIVEGLVKEGATGFVDRAGRKWGLDVYAEMAARTTTREAVTVGTLNRCLDLGQDLVTISEHANACPICVPYEGRTYSITGQTPGYPRLEVRTPFHPRCRHVTTPAAIFHAPGDDPPEVPSEALEEPKPTPPGPRAGATEPVDELPSARDHFKIGRGQLSDGSSVSKVVGEHLDSIDAVHSFPLGLPRDVPLGAVSDLGASTYGAVKIAYSGITRSAIDFRILLNRKLADDVNNSVAHELGHFLDAHAIGGSGRIRLTSIRPPKAEYPSKADPDYQDWRDAVRASDAGAAMLDHGGAYYGSWHEIFARCYEQWIAVRSGNGKLLEKIRRRNAEASGRRPFTPYWEDEADFAKVAAAMERLFATRGLLRERPGRRR